MLTKKERVYLKQYNGIGDDSYKHANYLFHQKFPNAYDTKKHCEIIWKIQRNWYGNKFAINWEIMQ